MLRRLSFGIAVSVFAVLPAQAAGIPTDESGFTSYVRQQLQLYSPRPVTVVAPYIVSVGDPGALTNLPSFKALHDVCVSLPTKCDGAVRDYVQNVARDVLQKPAPGAAAATAAPLQTPAGVTQLVVCNHGKSKLVIANVYVPLDSPKWRSVGWTPVDPGTCRGMLQTKGDTFYARAEAAVRDIVHGDDMRGGNTAGDATIANAGGDKRLCVPHRGNWDDTGDSPDDICRMANKEAARFRTFHNDGKPLQVWNLNN